MLIKTDESYWKLLIQFYVYRLWVCPISSLNKPCFWFTKAIFNVYKSTNFTVTLFTWTSRSHQPYHLSESIWIWQTNSQFYICMPSPSPSPQVLLQLKAVVKNIYKNKCREGEINTIFNRPCLLTSNVLIQFKQHMLVYEEYFNTGVYIYISHITIFTFATLV